MGWDAVRNISGIYSRLRGINSSQGNQRIRFGRIIALGTARISLDDRGTRKGLATLKARAPGEDPHLKP
jgi:hypothetical protein